MMTTPGSSGHQRTLIPMSLVIIRCYLIIHAVITESSVIKVISHKLDPLNPALKHVSSHVELGYTIIILLQLS